MPDYSKCVIYRLCCKDLNIKEIYVGSTCNFTRRKNKHKAVCNDKNDKDHNCKVYKFIRDNGGFENWDMILVEEYPCENIMQKLQRERYWCEELKADLNKQYPGRTKKEWYEDNKEQISLQKKEWYEDNKKQILARGKKYREENKEEISAKKKNYHEANKKEISIKKKEYYEANKKKIREKQNQKVKCEICNCEFSKNGKVNHERTKKHMKNLSNLNNNESHD